MRNAEKIPKIVKEPYPHVVVKNFLDEQVVGQESAKKILSVAVYNHYKRIYKDDAKNDDLEIQKSNVLTRCFSYSGMY